ncbi:pentatricopeptide repeat containing protein [Drechmeria coniospora]|uniref:Pentatricopeptide repeat containing protein n=1 Tax=Drechmeria coniospora TaxID=98403 RepID=A0A151GEN4_DRECN|nr:pentatricopeptide repeat containing protein [Drechmeria coniospora]KYK55532.1 pentatricopeptide repeat containing protein [Drechmeria coniospora]ODA81861.1 hypothetical protein RJ55_00366 [Drechmeria coniospora]
MPPRPLLSDFSSHFSSLHGPICRSCIFRIWRRTARPIAATYSSQATRKAKLPRVTESATRRPSSAELRQYLQGIRDLRSSKPDEKEGYSVRFFEQNERGRTELAGDDAFDHSLSRLDGAELQDALLDIKGVLSTQEEKDAFQAVMREMGGDLSNISSADDIEKATARMRAYTKSIDAEIEEVGASLPKEILQELLRDMDELPAPEEMTQRQRISPPQIPEAPWTPNQRKKIARLNVILARVYREMSRKAGVTTKAVSSVYKAYHAARIPLARGWGTVPIDVWDFLWAVLSADESINIHRLSHISTLARDMSEAKVTLSPSQQLLTIEAVFVDGWEAKAIENWKRCMSTLGEATSENFQEFWELGVRMHCRLGDMEQAERAAKKMLSKHLSARILLPLIRTYSEQGTAESQEKAWNLYRQMRELLGKEMKLSDYDQVVSYFLTTNQTENALYAFVDMMSDGDIDLKRQKHMPSVVANKFFLGKWLKRLIGAGDLDGAFSVVEFMRTKGVEASPIHLNGLIGAWQRSGGAEDLEKADRMAWDMVESRIDFVHARKSGGETTKTTKAVTSASSPTPWPRATIETFSLLAENYRFRTLHGKLEALWVAFRDAEISPDAFMMNQLLESHIQAGQPKEAVTLYHSLVSERGVSPDPYTFSALWKTLAVNRLHTLAPEALDEETEATRQLFRETVRCKQVFLPDGMDGQLARKILHTFRRLQDSAGFLVALAALKDVFQFLPPESLALELVLGTARLSWDTPSQRKRLMIAKRDMDRALLASVDGEADRLEGRRRGEALYEYLQKNYWPEEGAYEDKRRALVGVAKEMGVYELMAVKTTKARKKDGVQGRS